MSQKCKLEGCTKDADVSVFGSIKISLGVSQILSVPLCLEHYKASPSFELYYAIPLSLKGEDEIRRRWKGQRLG